jgi:hypothetical protein
MTRGFGMMHAFEQVARAAKTPGRSAESTGVYDERRIRIVTGKDCWGIAANDGPGFKTLKIDSKERCFLGYAARGVPYGPDDGTIGPCAALSSLPFAPELALSAVRHFCARYPEMIRDSRLPSGFNQTWSGRRPVRLGLRGLFPARPGHPHPDDRELSLAAIWKLMRRCHYIGSGLRRAGFTGGWLS